jgi:hypothetical protein
MCVRSLPTFIQLVFVGSNLPLKVTVSSTYGDNAPVTFKTGIFSDASAIIQWHVMYSFCPSFTTDYRTFLLRCSRWGTSDMQISPFYVRVDEQCQVRWVYCSFKVLFVNLWEEGVNAI